MGKKKACGLDWVSRALVFADHAKTVKWLHSGWNVVTLIIITKLPTLNMHTDTTLNEILSSIRRPCYMERV
jgi:hypothetical protein